MNDKNKVRQFKLTTLSFALGAAFSGLVHAQEVGGTQLPTITVEAPDVAYKIDRVQSKKVVTPLLDAPQSISTVSSQVLEEQQAKTLQDVLKNVPGITFMSGEGNLGWGDMFSIRGFSAEQSISIDGIRDAGLSSRTDIFNLEQAEVYLGTGSVESGVSAVGGGVNLVSKEAKLGSFYNLSGTIGTDNYKSVKADLNKQLGDSTALRLNLMRHHNGVAERNVTEYDRWGVAGSLALGLGTPTRFTLNFLHQDDDNIPDGGVPIQRGTGGQRMPNVSRDAWYGDANLYTEKTTNDLVTFKFEHDISDRLSVSNISRWQQTDRISVLSPARLSTAAGTSYGYGSAGNLISSPNGGVLSYDDYIILSNPDPIARLRGNDYGLSKRYEIIANQTNLSAKFDTAGVSHTLATGLEVYEETYGDLQRTIKAPSVNPTFNLAQNSGVDMQGVDTVKGATGSKSSVSNVGVYVNDSIALTEKWLLQAGVRYDRYKVTQRASSAAREFSTNNGVWGGRAGIVYKPVSNGSIYTSYSQAAQPSAIGASTNDQIYGAKSATDYTPAQSKTYELGTKWDLANGKVSVTGAIFQTEVSDSWDYGTGTDAVRALPAKRVRGLELSINGEVNKHWSASAGLSVLRSRITKGANEGLEAKNVPDYALNLWTTYAVNETLAFSYGAQYVGKRRYTDNKYVGGLNNSSSTVNGSSGLRPISIEDHEKAPSYWLHTIAARYKVNQNLTLGVNVDNLFNKFYYSRIGASLDGFQLYGVPGAGRTISVTANLNF